MDLCKGFLINRITDEQIGLSRISMGTDLAGGIKKIVFSKRGLKTFSRDNDLIAFFDSLQDLLLYGPFDLPAVHHPLAGDTDQVNGMIPEPLL